MTIRKRKQPTPAFRQPPPFEPITGKREVLDIEGIYPYCPLFQIAKEDTEEQYVVCRGYDPRNMRFYDYDGGDATGIPVAKPYQKRIPKQYRVGEIWPCVLPLTAGMERGGKIIPFIGQNPGRVDGATTRGNPLDLTEEIVHLKDDSGTFINWMILDSSKPIVRFELLEAYTQWSLVPVTAARKNWDPTANGGVGGFVVDCADVIYVCDLNEVGHTAGAGGYGRGIMEETESSPYWVCVIDDLCCPGDEQGSC